MTDMTPTSWADLGDDTSRSILIDVTGGGAPHLLRASHYQLKVPYSRLSQTVQRIGRTGGKITRVTVIGASAPFPPVVAPIPGRPEIEAKSPTVEAKSGEHEAKTLVGAKATRGKGQPADRPTKKATGFKNPRAKK